MTRPYRIPVTGKLRTWLSPLDPSVIHNSACNTRHGETSKWFIEGSVFQEWKRDGSLLWISGKPGAGKTILCSAVIESIKSTQEGKPVLAYYYFDKDASKSDLRGLLASLLFQLSTVRIVLGCSLSIVRRLSRWPRTAQRHRPCRMSQKHARTPGQLPIFVVVDALDECPSNHGSPSARQHVLDFVGALSGRAFESIHLHL
ncbi:hypothetical protein BC826DRAFT_512407 [Russula brevipes]|nr:hypothetical protein BC826DRAFT_512407 [Russula brevipes]